MVQLGRAIGGIGQVANLISLPFDLKHYGLIQKIMGEKGMDKKKVLMGLLFAGSRIGDSSLFVYNLTGDVPLIEQADEQDPKRRKIDGTATVPVKKEDDDGDDDVTQAGRANGNAKHDDIDNDHEAVLKKEEDDLYQVSDEVTGTPNQQAAPVTDDDGGNDDGDEDDDIDDEYEFINATGLSNTLAGGASRGQLQRAYVVETLSAVDCITAVGALGPSCEGPIGSLPTPVADPLQGTKGDSSPLLASPAKIFGCGYGSSGGLAVLTTPGRSDQSILAETDCLNVQSMYNLPNHGLVLLGMGSDKHSTSHINVLRMDRPEVQAATGIVEVDVKDWCSNDTNAAFIFGETSLLGAAELSKDEFLVLVDAGAGVISVEILSEVNGKVKVSKHLSLGQDEADGNVLSTSPLLKHPSENSITFGCVWESGRASVSTIGEDGTLRTSCIEGVAQAGAAGIKKPNSQDTDNGDDDDDDDDDDDGMARFYACNDVVAMDVFMAPKGLFLSPQPTKSEASSDETSEPQAMDVEEGTKIKDDGDTTQERKGNDGDIDWMDDEEYQELYGSSKTKKNAATTTSATASTDSPARGTDRLDDISRAIFVAVCRQSGVLEVYHFDSLRSLSTSGGGDDINPVWTARGCGHGVSMLSLSNHRTPKSHKVRCSELRFFAGGPTALSDRSSRLFLAVETNTGDLHVYRASFHQTDFKRQMLRMPTRPSKKQGEHHAKLKRRGILGKTAALGEQALFRQNRLFRFCGVSGQNGLFAGTARPMWLMAERGSVAAVYHQSKHVAPAGGKPRPISAFCTLGGAVDTKGYATLHERIGRVGSQRLTFCQR